LARAFHRHAEAQGSEQKMWWCALSWQARQTGLPHA